MTREEFIMEKKSRKEYRRRTLESLVAADKKTGDANVGGFEFKLKSRGQTESDVNSDGADTEIRISNKHLNTRHPNTSKFVLLHEIGHMVDYSECYRIIDNIQKEVQSYIDKIKKTDIKKAHKIADVFDSFEISYENLKPEICYKFIDKLKNAGVEGLDKYIKDVREFDMKIQKIIRKKGIQNPHGKSLNEYHADKAAASCLTPKDVRRSLKDLEIQMNKRIRNSKATPHNIGGKYISAYTNHIKDLKSMLSTIENLYKSNRIDKDTYESNKTRVNNEISKYQDLLDKADWKSDKVKAADEYNKKLRENSSTSDEFRARADVIKMAEKHKAEKAIKKEYKHPKSIK